MVAHGDEAFSDVMRVNFENAKRLYHSKLRPMLEEQHQVRPGARPAAGRRRAPRSPRRLQRFDNDDRLVKTLLLSALVPEVEPLKNLTASRLAALNHGTIKAPVPAGEAQVVLNKVRTWASRVGEIRVGEGRQPGRSRSRSSASTPRRSSRRPGSTTTPATASPQDPRAALRVAGRRRPATRCSSSHSFVWRGSRRRCDLLYTNVRELPDESLRAQGEDWKVVVDWPFDDPGHTPVEDHAKVDGFLGRNDSTRTLVWLPAFFSPRTQAELGKLVILDHLLRGDNLDQYAQHLSLQDRLSARLILENQQSALAGTLRLALNAAYGIAREPQPGMLDAAHEAAEGHFRSLEPGFTPQVPVGANLARRSNTCSARRWRTSSPTTRTSSARSRSRTARRCSPRCRRPRGSRTAACAVDKPLRPVIKLVANPLGLGHMGEQYFVLEKTWQTHFNKQLAAEKVSDADGGEAASVDGPAEAEGPGSRSSATC